jgi:hypothetical protein
MRKVKIHCSLRKFFSLGNLGFSPGREGAFLLKELWAFFLMEIVFFPKELFILHMELV